MNYILCVFIFLYFSFTGCKSNLSHDIYDLNFKQLENNNSPWNFYSENCRIEADAEDYILIKNNVQSGGAQIHNRNVFRLNQLIRIQAPVSEIKVILNSKSVNYKYLCLKVYCLDNEERIVARDSTSIQCANKWIKTNVNIEKTLSTDLLYIEIKGSTSIQKTKKEKDEAILWLDEVSILLDDVSIQRFVQETGLLKPESPVVFTEIVDIQDTNTYNGFNKIEDFKTHRIIALGETIHGSETINKNICQLIKYLVEKENCKLILIENSFSQVMSWNLYINGYEQIKIDSAILAYPILYSPKVWSEFIDWLKRYNDSTQYKVNIVGIDIAPTNMEAREITKYITNIGIKNELLDSLCFITEMGQFEKAYKLIQDNNTRLTDILGREIYSTLYQSLKIYGELKYTPSFSRLLALRDSFMWINTKFALENFKVKNSKAVIYSHFSHVNKLNSLPINFTSSLGYFLDKYCGSQYYVTGILTGRGTFTAWNDTLLVNDNHLAEPPVGSLEYQFMKMNKEWLYTTLSDNNKIKLLRFQGNSFSSNNQFDYYAIAKRMDACIFIKESTGFYLPPDWPKTVKEAIAQNRRYQQEALEAIKDKWDNKKIK